MTMLELSDTPPAVLPAAEEATWAGTPSMELRILTGMQAGARLGLGPQRYRLGAGADCDVILVGQGMPDIALTLQVHGEHWAHEDAVGASRMRAFGEPLQVSDVCITVDHVDAAWPSAVEIPREKHPATSGVSTASAVTAAPRVQEPSTRAALPAVEPSRRRAALGLSAIFVCVLVAGAAAVVTLMPRGSEAMAAPESALAARELAAPAQALALRAALERLGVSATVAVESLGAGGHVLRGFVPHADDLARLSKALPPTHGRLTMEVHADDVVRQRVAMVLADYLSPEAVQVENGIVRLHGPIDQPLDALVGQLRAAGVDFRTVVRLPLRASAPVASTPAGASDNSDMAQALRRLRALLAGAGLSTKAHASIDGRILRVGGSLSTAELESAQAVFLRFGQETLGAVDFVADFKTPPGGELPFRVVQVVGGVQPYVVTERKERIYVGGEQGGYRLVAVRDGKISFAGPRAVELKW